MTDRERKPQAKGDLYDPRLLCKDETSCHSARGYKDVLTPAADTGSVVMYQFDILHHQLCNLTDWTIISGKH